MRCVPKLNTYEGLLVARSQLHSYCRCKRRSPAGNSSVSIPPESLLGRTSLKSPSADGKRLLPLTGCKDAEYNRAPRVQRLLRGNTAPKSNSYTVFISSCSFKHSITTDIHALPVLTSMLLEGCHEISSATSQTPSYSHRHLLSTHP